MMKRLLILLLATALTVFSSSTFASVYYWVGGSGNWNDPAHWSHQSGGNPGAGLPAASDNVVFDNASFNSDQNHVILTSDVTINKFTFITTGFKPKISSANTIFFTVKSDWIVTGKFRNYIKGEIIFENNGNSILQSGDVHFRAGIRKKGNGTLKINQNNLELEPGCNLILEEGKINTNSKFIRATAILFPGNQSKNFVADNSNLVTETAINYLAHDLVYSTANTTEMIAVPQDGNNQLRANPNTCGAVPFTVTLSITTNYNGSSVTCNGSSDATVCAVVTGGVGPFVIQWQTGPASNCWTNIDAGTYTAVVLDQGQGPPPCAASISVVEPEALSVLFWTTINPSCPIICDGSATPFLNGGTPPYTYTWGSGETTPTAVQLCVGLNSLHVEDANLCPFDTTFFILTPLPIAANVVVTDVSCNGFCDGSAVSSPTGGNGAPYTWQWQGGSVTNSITNQCAGTYTLHIEDNNNCPFDTTVTITQPIALSVTLNNITNLVCNGVCTGSITVTSGNGTQPHSYQWYDAATDLPLAGQTSATASNLCAGDYYVIVTDANGCPQQSPDYTVTQPPAITSTPSFTAPLCNGSCDGVLSIISAGGTGAHTYIWVDAVGGVPIGNGTPLGGVCAGTYFAQVTDANGCIINSALVVVPDPPALVLTFNTVNAVCNEDCNGSATVTSVSGGTGALTVSWRDSVGTQIGVGNSIVGLCAGDYTGRVTDANGCILDVPFTITEPTDFTITLTTTPVSCIGTCNGTATLVLISGQTSPYTIDWSTSANTGLIESNLCAGNFTVTITDANGCDSIHPFSIANPTPLTLAPAFADPSCTGVCDGTASANPSGGSGVYTYTWIDINSGLPIGQVTDTVINLCPGDYQVTVTDGSACTASTSYTITDPGGMTGTVSTTNSNCGICDGTTLVTVVGGNSPYSVVWMDATSGLPTGNTNNPATNVCAGNYYAIITDFNGCSVLSDTATLTDNVVMSASGIGTDPTCFGFCDGSIDITVVGGTLPISFDWFDQATNNPIGQTTEDATGLCDGTYYVTIFDVNGCTVPPVVVTVTEPTQLTGTASGTDATCFGVCNGSATSTPSGGTAPYTFSWVNTTTGVVASASQNPAGLCAGTYDLTITDAGNCTFGPISITINEPSAITFSVAATDANCFNVCDGSAIASAAGGTGPYSFVWSSSGNTTANENGLCDGNYTVSMTDANGCPAGPLPFTISEPTQLTASTTNGSVLCFGDCNGSVSVLANGGSSPYTYQWNAAAGNQITPVASGLCAGNFQVTVTDANGCTVGPLAASITEPTQLTGIANATDAACNGNCNGTGTATPAGGTVPYSYQWDDALSQTTQTAISLCGGTYTVIISDANGCSVTPASVTVNEPAVLALSTTQTDATCNALCDGTATVIPVGGTGPFTFIWDDPAAQTTATATGLCAGTYSVTVTDFNGCSGNISVTITEPTALTASTASTNSTCNTCDGSATVTPSGGTGVISIQWDAAAANQVTPTATLLCAGLYDAFVTDANGCLDTFTVAVSDNNGEILTVDSTNATCSGSCDGSVTVSFNCSDPNCSLVWDDLASSTTNTVLNLCAGTYGVTVTNNSGCVSAATVDVGEPNALDANETFTSVLCNGDCNGTGIVAPTGGTAPYSVQWDASAANQTTTTAFNLCAANYTVVVTDANGCTDNASITVTEPTVLSFNTAFADASCNGVCDGTGTAFPSGGTAPYSYQWDDAAAQTTQLATGLCAGDYNITVVDANGCTAGPSQITITEPSALSLTTSSVNPNCNGDCNGSGTATVLGGTSPYSYQWDDVLNQTTQTATNLCGGTYNVNVTDVNGCPVGPSTIVLNDPIAITITPLVTNIDCDGNCNGSVTTTIAGGIIPYTYQWNDPAATTTQDVFNLCAGVYDLDVTDANGCVVTSTNTITEPAVISANITANNITCNGSCNGSVTATPSGGTAPYSYLWSNGAITSTISGLCPGTYDVTITDANGCTINASRNITEPGAITLTSSSSSSSCGVCNGSVSVSPVGGTAGYSYQWDAAAANQTTQSATALCAGIYSVTVTDAAGCTANTSVGLSDVTGETVVVNGTDASCFGVCDGSATAVTACVSGPCSFDWFDVATGAAIGQTLSTASALCAADYFVEVTNGVGCITVANVTINEPTEIFANATSVDLLCNAVCTGSITLAPSGGAGGYTFLWNTGAVTQNLSNLCAGTYFVDITDATGCTARDTIVITEPALLDAVVTGTDVLCNGDCNGTATATITGGTLPYTISWNDPGTQSTAVAVGLCVGTFTVVVNDANGCSDNGSATINEPAILSATANATDALCNGDCNGTATATPLGGTAPYTFTWDDPALQNTQTANGLCAGNYNVIVGDANNCATNPVPVVVNEPASIAFNVNSTDISCSGSCNGTITIVAAGGSGVFSFSINNGASFQASGNFNSLCAGSYDVIVQDANGCTSVSQNVNINEPTLVTATSSFFAADCNVANGAASIFPSGGTPPYTYNWMDVALNPIGQVTQTAINLFAGIYVVDVTDANGCVNQFSVTVSNVNAPNIPGVATNVSCSGDCNGSIDVTTSGGNAPYSYLWVPGGQTTEDVSNLCAGGYLLQVTDASGCINFANFSITEPNAVNGTFVLTDATCGQCDGTAVVTPTGGTAGYTFAWSNGQNTANASGLCAGAYMVQITDANGCSQTFNTSVNSVGGPTGETITQNNVSCNSLCDGDATIAPIGGTAPYSYYWIHDGSALDNAASLCAGTYFVEVTDANGCIRVTNVTITEPQQFNDSIVLTPATCGVCDGVLSVFMIGGTVPYTYQWDAAAGSVTTSNAQNLCEGIYSVVVTDANGCSDSLFSAVNGSTSAQLTVNATDASCQGICDGTADVITNGGTAPFVITWLDASGNPTGLSGTPVNSLCANDYFVQVDDAAGCSSFTPFTIGEPDSLLFSLPFIQTPSCFNTCDGVAVAIVIEGTLPYTFSWNDPASQTTATAINMCGGSFDVTVTDGNGCSSTQNVIITAPTAITLALDSIDASCSTVNDGSIDATPAGGASGFTFSWTGPNNFTAVTEDITNLFPGTYTVTVTDLNGCSLTDSIVVNALLVVNAFAGNDTTICANGSGMTLTGSGGVTYEWYDMAGTLLAATQTLNISPNVGVNSFVLVANNNGCTGSDTINITVNALPVVSAGPDVDIIIHASATIGGNPTTIAGNTVTWNPVTDLNDPLVFNPTASPDSTTTYIVTVTDPNGCTNSDTMVVQVFPDITFPNGFSPNGDGRNDVWEIDFIYLFPECQVEVYNRWGQLLFLSIGYGTPWDGTYNNQPVPVGTYYYIINLNHPLYPDAYTGPLTVLR